MSQDLKDQSIKPVEMLVRYVRFCTSGALVTLACAVIALNSAMLPGSAPAVQTLLAPIFGIILASTFVVITLAAGLTRRLRQRLLVMEQAQAKFARTALIDPLTNLPNRAHLVDHLNRTLAAAQRKGRRVGICQVDLTGFGRINDNLGRATGDAVLAEVAARLNATTRQAEFLARIGEDRFVLVAPEIEEHSELSILLKRLRIEVAKPIDTMGGEITLGLCASIVHAEQNQTNAEQVLADAAIALATAKSNGPDRTKLFTPDLRTAHEARQIMREELNIALDSNQIEPWFQPQINARTGKISGFEALARWRHPKRGLLGPTVFLDSVMEFGLSDRLSEAVLAQSLEALCDWRRLGLDAPKIGVNFSAIQLSDPFTAEKIKWQVETRDLDPEDICIEVLESVFMDDASDAAGKTVAALSRAGFMIDLDDFGTGRSSIASLQRCPVSRIKIDRSFITEIDIDKQQKKVVGAMIDLAHSLDVEVLAEGVETDSQRNQLMAMGCEYLQGFGIARPMPADEIASWVLKTAPSDIRTG
ncbi:MAG: putative bifunctional diguanylate cyclase/phosphodiesterase [Pikeienuella sp.]